MKRRHFSRKNSFVRGIEDEQNVLPVDSDDNVPRDGRVSLLSDAAKASVRAGQVIGSLSRAIEELVRNSVVHGRATAVDVKVGTVKFGNSTNGRTTLLEVKDNGTGIDANSTQTLIGTEHCSSSYAQVGTRNENNHEEGRSNGGDFLVQHKTLKGETLKSLAALSVEFRVTTASLIRKGTNSSVTSQKVMKESSQQRQRTFAPSKSRRRYRTDYASNEEEEYCEPNVVVCEKIIRQGKDVSFKSSTCKKRDSPFVRTNDPNKGNYCTGTSIRVFGLFHGFAVRKRQYDISTQSLHDMSVDRVKLNQARHCIQVLAMAFPNISIRLVDAVSDSVHVAWTPTSSLCSNRFPHSSQLLNHNTDFNNVNKSIKNRLHQLCGEKISSKCSFVDLSFTEDEQYQRSASLDVSYSVQSSSLSSSSSSSFPIPLRSAWKIDGVICCIEAEKDKSTSKLVNRSRQQELIFVNGLLSKQNFMLGDLIQQCFSSSSKYHGKFSIFVIIINKLQLIVSESSCELLSF